MAVSWYRLGRRRFFQFIRRFRRSVTQRIAAGVVVVGVIAFVFLQLPVNAGTASLVPDGDSGTMGWTTVGSGGGSCVGAHCDLVDENFATPDTANYISAPQGGGGGEIDSFTMSSFAFPAGVTNLTSVTANIYDQNAANDGTLDTVTISLFLQNAYQTAVTVTPANGSWGWHSATFTGSWTQSDVDNMQFRVTRIAQGKGSASKVTDDVRIATIYVTASYVTNVDFNQAAYRWYANADSTSPGLALAAQDTAITAPAQGTPFRLRLLLDISKNPLTTNSQAFTLQYAPKSGTCGTYSNISATAGDIRVYNNPTPASGAPITTTANDPQYLSHPIRPQAYNETGSFTNAASDIAVGEAGLWDFSLVDYSATAGSSYCFRVVKADGGQLTTYGVTPELTTAAEPDSGVQYLGDHASRLALGGSTTPENSQLFLDFTKVVGTIPDTLIPQVELQSTAASFTGTPTYAGTPVSATFQMPNLRMQACSAYDPVGKRMIEFGGQGNTTSTHYNDAWALNLPKDSMPSWTVLTANGATGSPASRRGCAAVYDSSQNRFIIFGGRNTSGTTIWYNDVWSLSLGATPTWTQLCTASSCGTAPSGRSSLDMIYDPVGNQIILFGGYTGSFLGDTWKLSLGGTPAWYSLTPTVTPLSGGALTGRAGYSFEYDPVNRLGWMVDGTTSGPDLNDTWKYNIATNTWTQVFLDGCAGPCPARAEGTIMSYDPVNQQMVLFGGYSWATSTTSQTTSILSNLSGTPSWSTPAIDSPLPHARYYANSIYDSQNNRMVLFAGEDYSLNPAGVNKDLSALYLPSGGGKPFWRGMATNVVMNGRDQMAPYYDVANKYAYIFGGFGDGTMPQTDTTGTHVSETYRLDLRTGRAPRWRNVSSQEQSSGAVPLAREAVSFATDTSRNQFIIFGGLHENNKLNDVWVADMSDPTKDPVWKQLCSATSCGTAPSVRWLAPAIYDAANDRFILFGGEGQDGSDYNDVWALSLGSSPTWTQLTPSGTAPHVRFGGAMVYDAPNNRMVIWGGQTESGTTTGYNDTWAMSLGASPAWTQLTPSGTAPTGRRSMAYALSSKSGINKMIIFAGYNISSGALFNDVATLDLSTVNGSWTTLSANDCSSPTAPACRRSTSGVYDPNTNKFTIFAGRNVTDFYNDAYSFDLTSNAWENLKPVNEIRFSVPVSGLADNAYHWQYRTTGASGTTSYLAYGQNSDTPTAGTDFTSCGVPTIEKRLRQGTYFCGQTKQYKYQP